MNLRGWTIALLAIWGMNAGSRAEQPPDWPAWRGPRADGSVEDGRYPVAFDAEKCRWKTELPGRGVSTPIVRDGRIYLTAPVEGKDAVLCFDPSGREAWRTAFGAEDPGKHRNGSGCNASPVADDDAVFVYFKSGVLAAVSLQGEVRWQTNLVERFGKANLYWDHGNSPVLTKRHVVMVRIHEGESWVAAFDKQTGELAWKVPRNYETPVEGDQGYATPLVVQHAGQEAVLVWGAEHLTLHDAASGEVLWWCGNFNEEQRQLWPSIATPVVADEMVVVAHGRNDHGLPRLFGIRLAGSGDVTAANRAWMRNDVGTFVPSPLASRGRVMLVGDQGEVECLDPQTGATIWKDRLPKHRAKFYSSPLLAGNRLYAAREDGVVFVAEVGDDGLRLAAENDMGEPVIACPVPLGGDLLIRGERHLFCVAAEQGLAAEAP
jgi:outer membrane protein assembly factor BamB